jgi:hypothetical protein
MERIANTTIPAELKGAEVGPTLFYKIAGAGALALIGGKESRAALRRLMNATGRYDRDTVAVALSTYGNEKDVPWLVELVDERPINDGMSRDFVLGEVGRLGQKAIPVFLAALPKGGSSARMAVFGLVNIGRSALSELERTIQNATLPASVRHGAKLAHEWIRPK